ncbi:putative ATPase [Bradyrhizobium sp. GM22.5]
MLSTPSSSFREAYQAQIASGAIEPDAAQAEIADAYAALDQLLADYKPPRKQGLLSRLFSSDKDEAPHGLYVHGEVGRGKTMLMDLFFQHSTVEHKRRAHFHEFMAEVHERIYDYRQGIARGEIGDGDVIALTAHAIFEESWLLCFDEFHVTDIADAMILGRLFAKLLELGTVVVATSNVAPDDLYKGGLNRSLFLPFIRQITDHMDVLRLDARTDFRLEKLQGVPMLADAGRHRGGRRARPRLVEDVRRRQMQVARYFDQGPHPARAVLGPRRGALHVRRSLRQAARGIRLSQAGARLSHHPGRPYSSDGFLPAQRRQAFHYVDRHAV